jgi:hypothetical protein
VEPPLAAPIIVKILTGIPESEFDNLKWINKPRWQDFRADIGRMAEAMLMAHELYAHGD